MRRRLHGAYFSWLCDQVLTVIDQDSAESYLYICQRMHVKGFLALVPHDENRINDVNELRWRFLHEVPEFSAYGGELIVPGATMFEVIAELAHRASFQNNLPVQNWFMQFIKNLGLDRYPDNVCYPVPGHSRVDTILNRLNNRRYAYDGQGGLFPLVEPREDQRLVELWYQLGAYINQYELY